jgi:hypothetical protein
MNSLLETVRGSWLARDRETAEASRKYLRQVQDEIPADIWRHLECVVAWADKTEAWDDIILDVSIKQSVKQLQDQVFLEDRLRDLVRAVRSTWDSEALRLLHADTNKIVEQIQQRKFKEETEAMQRSLKQAASG